MKIVDDLIKLHYGSFTELCEYSPRDLDDIFIVLKSKEQQEALAQALGSK